MVNMMVWACTLIGMSCDAPTPNVDVIQSAYEQEATGGSKLHDSGLKVLEASCQTAAAPDNFLCQVTFLSKADPNQRLYFDVVAVAHTAQGWQLKSGLCKR